MENRSTADTILGLLCVVMEPVTALQLSQWVKCSEADASTIIASNAQHIEASRGKFIAKDDFKNQQGDLRWAHGIIAMSALSKIPGFGSPGKPRTI